MSAKRRQRRQTVDENALTAGLRRLFLRGGHAGRTAAAAAAPYVRRPAATVTDAMKTLTGLVARLTVVRSGRGPAAAATATTGDQTTGREATDRKPRRPDAVAARVAWARAMTRRALATGSVDALAEAAEHAAEEAHAAVAELRAANRRAVAAVVGGATGVRSAGGDATAAARAQSLLAAFGGAAQLRTVLTGAGDGSPAPTVRYACPCCRRLFHAKVAVRVHESRREDGGHCVGCACVRADRRD